MARLDAGLTHLLPDSWQAGRLASRPTSRRSNSDLTAHIHSGSEAQGLLETERKNKTLSFVGLAGGLVSAGIATALFAF